MDALFQFLGQTPPLRVADLGCGMGWLAHHLAARGHEVYAVDVTLDPRVGLGAAGEYVQKGPFFERVWGELESPPFRSESLDLVVFNASLHYVPDLSAVAGAVARVLRPGGRCIVMNSPVYRDPRSASRAQADFRGHLRAFGAEPDLVSRYNHLLLTDLIRSLTTGLGSVEAIPFDPGRRFRASRRLKGIALRMELANFPMFCATKPTTQSGDGS